MCADQTTVQSVFGLTSPAKINLGLRIVGRDARGYHLLQSLFVPLDFGDRMEVSAAASFRVHTRWEDCPRPEGPLPAGNANLVHRFLANLPDEVSRWEVTLHKRIPLGSGLGGGSSNVGTLARWLASRYPSHRDTIQNAARKLGSDVEFFLDPGVRWVEGTGDKLSVPPLQLPEWGVALVFPPLGCSTPEVYDRYRNGNIPFSEPLEPPANADAYLAKCENDLEKVVRESPIPEVITALKDSGALYAGMSGSGSTCFGIFPSRQAAQNNLKALQSFFRITQCKSVSVQTCTLN